MTLETTQKIIELIRDLNQMVSDLRKQVREKKGPPPFKGPWPDRRVVKDCGAKIILEADDSLTIELPERGVGIDAYIEILDTLRFYLGCALRSLEVLGDDD